MNSPRQILLISGSLRAGSTNTALMLTAQAVAPPGIDAVLYTGLNDLPHFNPDLDFDPLPPAVAALRASLKASHAVLFCTPEYAGALPGSFKNVLDWMAGSTEMTGMPVGWVNVASVAAPTGGSGAHDSLRSVLGYLNAHIVETACLRFPMQRADIGPDGLIANCSLRLQLTEALRKLSEARLH